MFQFYFTSFIPELRFCFKRAKDDKINLKGLKMTCTKCEKIHKKMVTFPDLFLCETLTEILSVDTFKMKQ